MTDPRSGPPADAMEKVSGPQSTVEVFSTSLPRPGVANIVPPLLRQSTSYSMLCTGG